MKLIFWPAIFMLALCSCSAPDSVDGTTAEIFPQPRIVERKSERYQLTPAARVCLEATASNTVNETSINNFWNDVFGSAASFNSGDGTCSTEDIVVTYDMDSAAMADIDGNVTSEAYVLAISSGGIRIESISPHGVFNA